MARRGAALADIRTNEELEQLLTNKCLHVLNVYDGFFGPCNSIATNLRDFKMLHGGDDLQITTVNVDKIDVFRRFRNKSEPTYLMVVDGLTKNSYYGTNVSELLEILKEEIAIFKSGEDINRHSYALRDMSTLEAQRFKSKRDELIFNRKKEQMKKQQLVYDYRLQVTSNIMDNVSDIGVTVFMPHTLDEELLTNVIDAAAPIHMQMKTSVVTEITREDLDMVNFDNENLSPLLFNHIVNQEVLIVAWKMASGELRPVDEVFSEFAIFLRDEGEFEKKSKKGKKKKGKKKKVVEVIPEGEEVEEVKPPFKLPVFPVPLKDLQKEKANPIRIEPIDLQFIESDADVIKLVCESIIAYTEHCIFSMHDKCIKEALGELITNMNNNDEETAEEPKKKKKKKTKGPVSTARGEVIFDPKDKTTAYVCPVWTPPTPRSHSAFLFLYFRRLLSFFLPMDPPGASRYVIVVFNALRHEEILEFMMDHNDYAHDILAHGLFRGFVDGDNYENTELICKAGVQYRMGVRLPDDKIILKIVANTEALLAMTDLGPEFVSQNEHDGQAECDVIFPLGYTNMTEEQAEAELELDAAFGEPAVDAENLEDGGINDAEAGGGGGAGGEKDGSADATQENGTENNETEGKVEESQASEEAGSADVKVENDNEKENTETNAAEC